MQEARHVACITVIKNGVITRIYDFFSVMTKGEGNKKSEKCIILYNFFGKVVKL
jgi:hypothetical protein